MFRGYLTVLWVLTTLPVATPLVSFFARCGRLPQGGGGRPWGGIRENRDLGTENSQFSVTESG